jgi:hypothetical protein
LDFKERLDLTKELVKDCPYKTQKDKISELFSITKNDIKEDILLRLIVIDSCYSTNMNRRFFGFEELTELIIKIESKYELDEDINVIEFTGKTNLKQLIDPVGIYKNGKQKGHAFSLISKYLYFRTKFNFPIYDSLVFDGLIEEKLIKSHKKPNSDYFKILSRIKNIYNISFDDLDIYFWVCGKIRKGSLSLIISDVESYIEFIKDLNLWGRADIKSVGFDKLIAKQLKSEKDLFKTNKLKKIQELARSIAKEKVFTDILNQK